MNIVGIIPARMASSRFPNKPMTDILGIPMIGHVYYRSKFCKTLKEVYVATCDDEIKNYVEGIGGKVIMTSPEHNRASERTAEAIGKLNAEGKEFEYVIMIQGDLPLIMPEMIEEIINPLSEEENIKVVDMIAEIMNEDDFRNENNVKVVMDINNYAIYYSREPIPSTKKTKEKVQMWRQPGLIMFQNRTLLEYVALKPTPLEIIESVDMNRFLENGIKIKFVKTKYPHHFCSIDVPNDKSLVLNKLKNDPYISNYGV